jgi:formylmethanofuran:tetrahydromethanopterin formyltransferase
MQRWRPFPVKQGEFELEASLGTKEGVIQGIMRRMGAEKYPVRWERPDGAID